MWNQLAISYNVRHLLARKVVSLMTLGAISLVVLVYVASLMLAAGLEQTLGSTGLYENIIVIRTGSQNEVQSGINRDHVGIVLSEPEVKRSQDQKPVATTDVVRLISLRKRQDGARSNVTLRGVSPTVGGVRKDMKLVQGRAPLAGTRELMVGKPIHDKFSGVGLGDAVRLVGTNWNIVGVFEGGTSAFGSEIWGDAEVLLQAFKMERFSSVTFRLAEGADFEALKHRLENDPRLTVTVKREIDFYADQSRSLALFIQILGSFVSAIFAIGAVIGVMITMYSAVAFRTREIGILRAIGFSKKVVFISFIKECLLISFLGGLLGVVLSFGLGFLGVTTTNFSTFAEVSFAFTPSFSIAMQGILFSIIMGLLGAVLPAIRASRVKILSAIREG